MDFLSFAPTVLDASLLPCRIRRRIPPGVEANRVERRRGKPPTPAARHAGAKLAAAAEGAKPTAVLGTCQFPVRRYFPVRETRHI